MNKSTDSLSKCASAIAKLSADHAEGAHYDSAIDGGEFSGPAHCEMEAASQVRIIEEHGYTVSEFWEEMKQRVCGKWLHFCFPHNLNLER